MSDNFATQPNLDQDEHAKWLASKTRQEVRTLAKNLAELMRSKEQSASNSSETDMSAPSSDRSE